MVNKKKGNKKRILPKSRITYENSKVKGIDLTDIPIEQLPEIFLEFMDVEDMILGPDRILLSNQLTTIPKEIELMQNLKTLDISFNKFRELPVVLKNLKNLQKLSLECNSPSEELFDQFYVFPVEESEKIQQDITGFENVNQISELILDGTKITNLPNSFSLLTNLKKLSLNYCGIKNINTMCDLIYLQEVHLKNNGILKIPSVISKLKDLEHLEITVYNTKEKESIIPETFCNLPKLRNLIFTNSIALHNQLPECLPNLANLEILELLNSNLLLPSSIGKLTKLKQLKLEENPLTNLPTDIGNCICLEKLEVTKTPIQYLPDSITILKDLTYLDLSHNNIKQLHEEIGQLEKLEYLNIDWNDIEYIQ